MSQHSSKVVEEDFDYHLDADTESKRRKKSGTHDKDDSAKKPRHENQHYYRQL